MAKVNFKRIQNSSQIDNLPVEDGAFIVTSDGKSYIDYGNNRVPTNGTPDTEMSDTSRNAVENKVIKEYIDDNINSLKPTLLWTNPNPNNKFEPQSITLSSDDYDFLEIYYYDWGFDPMAWKNVKCVKTLKGYNTVLEAIMSYDGKAFIGARLIRYVSNTSLQVDKCYSLVDGNTFSIITPNAWCLPIKIYGYKYS